MKILVFLRKTIVFRGLEHQNISFPKEILGFRTSHYQRERALHLSQVERANSSSLFPSETKLPLFTPLSLS